MQFRKAKMTCWHLSISALMSNYEDGTYDALWKKWIDASGEGEEAAAEEDTAAEDTAAEDAKAAE